MSETFSKVEVITGVARRRRFPTEQKVAVVAETMQPGMSIQELAGFLNRSEDEVRQQAGLRRH